MKRKSRIDVSWYWKLLTVVSFALLCVSVVQAERTARAARSLTAAEYITDIKIVKGDSSIESASESGWKVMADRIAGSAIAYRTGDSKGSALKDLRLLKSGGATETIDDISYQELGDIGGMTLYGTKDAKAGDAIAEIRLVEDQIVGDGTHTVRNEKGEVMELGDNTYLTVLYSDPVGIYISEMARISAGSEKAAIKKAANHGYDFFRLIRDDGGEVEMIAFNRTGDEKKAVRGVYAVGETGDYKLFYSVSEAAGAPITDIDLKEVSDVLWEGGTFSLSDWGQMNFGTNFSGSETNYRWNTISLYKDNAELGQALKDHSQGGTAFDIVVAQADGQTGGDGEIELVGEDMSNFSSTDAEKETESGEEKEGEDLTDDSDTGASDTPVDETAYDEPNGEEVNKEAEEPNEKDGSEEGGTEGEGDDDAETTGSMIGSGSMVLIICGGIILAGILVIAIYYRKKTKGVREDD